MLTSASLASAAVIVSYSAKSGGFHAGRVTLRSVSGRARYVTDTGHSGTVSLRRVDQRVFLPGKPPTGLLHIAGRSHDLTFRLSKPRYSGSRETASYTVKPLPGTSRLRPPPQFGDASLTILPNRALGDGGGGLGSTSNGPGLGGTFGNDCIMQADTDLGGENLTLQSSSNWNTDTWTSSPPARFPVGTSIYMESQGGLWRGCSFQAVYAGGPGLTITLTVTWPWQAGITTTCTSSDTTQLVCQRHDTNVIGWDILPGKYGNGALPPMLDRTVGPTADGVASHGPSALR